jgi:hypothetical protein
VSGSANPVLDDLARRARLGPPVAQERARDGWVVSLHVQRETGKLWILDGDMDQGGALAGGLEPVATAMLDDMLIAGGEEPAHVAEVELGLGGSRRRVRPNHNAAWLVLFEDVWLPATLRVRKFDARGAPIEEYGFDFSDRPNAPLSRLWDGIRRSLRRRRGRRLLSY